jgi:RNA polymerase sigma-70 factor (ECF subfamily)
MGTQCKTEILFPQFLDEEDTAGFELLYRDQYRSLCQFAQRYLNNIETAEEAVSEVFYKIWKNRKQISIQTSAKYYLYKSVRNMAIDLNRQARAHVFTTADCLESRPCIAPDATEILIEAETKKKIETAIQHLPTQCQKIFRLSRIDGLKYHEIATFMGISIKTVETQITRALRALRAEMAY